MPDIPKHEVFDRDGSLVESRDYTAAEIAARNRGLLEASDAGMLRVIDDIYEVLTPEQKAALPQAARDKIARRKAMRAHGA